LPEIVTVRKCRTVFSSSGNVKYGMIVLEDAIELPEGAEVLVELIPQRNAEPIEREIPTLYERLKPVIGKATGLPPDFARNHDHYLHGKPHENSSSRESTYIPAAVTRIGHPPIASPSWSWNSTGSPIH